MKRGISLLTISIVVLVMALLVTTVTLTGSNIVSKSRKLKFATELIQVKKAVEEYEIRKDGALDFDTVTLKVSSLSRDKKICMSEEQIIDGSITLYIVDISMLDVEEVSIGNVQTSADDRYLYSSVTKNIYYDKGYEINGTTYYGLNDELNELIK